MNFTYSLFQISPRTAESKDIPVDGMQQEMTRVFCQKKQLLRHNCGRSCFVHLMC